MRIESIKIQNFKAFKDVEMADIPRFCVLIGANGTGKTTFFDVFGFLKDCLVYDVRKALQVRGGFNEVLSKGCDHRELIYIELKFRQFIKDKERTVTYILEIGAENNNPYVNREVLRYKRGRYGSPFHFLDFSKGTGYAIPKEEDFDKLDEELDKEYQALDNQYILAVKGLGQFQRFKAANAFRQFIENWHVSDFHINLARGVKDAAGMSEHLSVTGDNLQQVAYNLYETRRDILDKIISKMKQRIPGVTDVIPQSTEDGRLLLKFQDGSFSDPFIDRFVSDGTMKMFAYLVLLYDPQPHPLLCVEEPENQLYPSLLEELAEEFREYANRGGQVFVSTHSPDFINATELHEVYWLSKKLGYTTIKRAKNDPLISNYMKEGDKMGYLWKQKFFDGVDPE